MQVDLRASLEHQSLAQNACCRVFLPLRHKSGSTPGCDLPLPHLSNSDDVLDVSLQISPPLMVPVFPYGQHRWPRGLGFLKVIRLINVLQYSRYVLKLGVWITNSDLSNAMWWWNHAHSACVQRYVLFSRWCEQIDLTSPALSRLE